MTQDDISKVEDLLEDSFETLTDKKSFTKTQNTMIRDYAKRNGVEPSVLKRIKNYYHYKGANWLNGNPLEKDTNAKDKDKVSPIFIKLLEVFEDLSVVDDVEFLKPYLDKLVECGITINYKPNSVITLKDDVSTVKEMLESASKLQTNIDTLSEQLKEEKAVESEDIGFTPKSAFSGVLSIYEKMKNDKEVDDSIQNGIATNMMIANAYNYLSQVKDKENN